MINYLGIVNRVLGMCKQSSVTAISTTVGSDAYNVQTCINDTIADMSHVLRIKKRLANFTITTVASQRVYRVPKRVTYPFLDLRQTNSEQKITQMPTAEFDQFVPSDDSSGDPAQYYLEEYSAVQNQPAAAGETVYAVSDSASDNSTVVIQGYDTNNNYVSDEISLSGTTAVASASTFVYIDNIAKIATTGTITFRNSGSTTTYLTLSPKETSFRGMVIGLHPVPSAAITIYGRSYLRPQELINEYDTPIGFNEDHVNAIVFGSLWRYRKFTPDFPNEAMTQTKQDYIDELQKIIGQDASDPDMIVRMRGPYEVRGHISTVRALDRRYP